MRWLPVAGCRLRRVIPSVERGIWAAGGTMSSSTYTQPFPQIPRSTLGMTTLESRPLGWKAAVHGVFLLAMVAVSASAQSYQPIPAARVADDAKAIDRVAEMSRKDLPVAVLRRIINEDIDLLRGKRSDGTYQYARYDRMESGRFSDSFSIQPADSDRLVQVDIHGQFVYRVILEVPTRRLLVTKNRRLWIDHIDIEYIPEGASATKTQSVKVETWLEPGQSKPIDFAEIARQATVRVFARADKATGYGNLAVTLVEARVFDNPDSPYADAVSSAKAIVRGLDHSDISSIRSMAQRMVVDLRPSEGAPVVRSIDIIAKPVSEPSVTPAPAMPSDVYTELQAIEDLMTGTDAERRQGLDRLHQLLRRLRK
jgi:hypothetical protein